MGPQPQKSVNGNFLFAVMLFVHLHQRIEQLPEKNKEDNMITMKIQFL